MLKHLQQSQDLATSMGASLESPSLGHQMLKPSLLKGHLLAQLQFVRSNPLLLEL
jgi:hypothetical protein